MTDEMNANYETLMNALTNEMQALHKELQKCKEKLSQEPCEDCIRRQDLREPRFIIAENDYQKGWNDALESVYENAPSIQPQPKVGRWKRINKEKYVQHAMSYYRCSECGKDIIGTHNYCPNCGCKMQEV